MYKSLKLAHCIIDSLCNTGNSYIKARQIVSTVTSVHATCTQKGFCVHEITCT